MNEEALKIRLDELADKKYKLNEEYKIINDFLLAPRLPELIELDNVLHKVQLFRGDGGSIYQIVIYHEKPKRLGFWYGVGRHLNPWKAGIKIYYSNPIFICEFYKYNFFSFADKLKEDYNEYLKTAFNLEFVIVDKSK